MNERLGNIPRVVVRETRGFVREMFTREALLEPITAARLMFEARHAPLYGRVISAGFNVLAMPLLGLFAILRINPVVGVGLGLSLWAAEGVLQHRLRTTRSLRSHRES